MRKAILLQGLCNLGLLVLLSSPLLHAQSFTFTKPSSAHQQIPGTPLWLIPPTGFAPSGQFKGFQHPDYPTASLMVVEVPAPVHLIFEGMTAEALAGQDMTLVTSDTLRFHERLAYWLTIDQRAMGMDIRKHLFAFGDEAQTFMLNATFSLDTESAWGDSLRQSLYTLVWEETAEIDPLAALPYELPGIDSLGWQVASVMGTATVYSFDGKVPTNHPDGAVFIVDKSLQDVAVYDGESFLRRRLKNFRQVLTPDEERGFTEVEIDGLKGTSCYATENDEEGQISSYYRLTVLMPEAGGYYLLMGITKVDEPRIWDKVALAITSFRRR